MSFSRRLATIALRIGDIRLHPCRAHDANLHFAPFKERQIVVQTLTESDDGVF